MSLRWKITNKGPAYSILQSSASCLPLAEIHRAHVWGWPRNLVIFVTVGLGLSLLTP